VGRQSTGRAHPDSVAGTRPRRSLGSGLAADSLAVNRISGVSAAQVDLDDEALRPLHILRSPVGQLTHFRTLIRIIASTNRARRTGPGWTRCAASPWRRIQPAGPQPRQHTRMSPRSAPSGFLDGSRVVEPARGEEHRPGRASRTTDLVCGARIKRKTRQRGRVGFCTAADAFADSFVSLAPFLPF
jgi:hypothetical protein